MTVRILARPGKCGGLVLAGMAAMLSSLVFLAQPIAAEGAGFSPKHASMLHAIGAKEDQGVAATLWISFYLPFIGSGGWACQSTGQSYGTAAMYSLPPPSDPPAELHPDMNLSVRGYVSVTSSLELVNYGGATDEDPPQLPTLFVDNRTAQFVSTYRVYSWNWDSMNRGDPYLNWPVTLLGLRGTNGEIVQVPGRKNLVGLLPYDGDGYQAIVLYASESRLTLSYTRAGTVADGYAIHLENVCVDSNLLMLYRMMNSQGRVRLPGLLPGQALGRLRGTELGVAIRDKGDFMDPRSRKDWWQGR